MFNGTISAIHGIGIADGSALLIVFVICAILLISFCETVLALLLAPSEED